jgi:hydroxyacylglutathione hydrolase
MICLINRQIGKFVIVTIETSERWHENCYVVQDKFSGEQTIIDPGAAAESIAEVVLEHGGKPRHILLTHAHHDHVGAVPELRRRFEVPCYLHAFDKRLLRQAPLYAFRFGGERFEPAEPVCTFNAELDLSVGDTIVRTIHTPGHTAGSVCYLFPGMAFTGDTLMYRRVGRHDLPGGDSTVLSASIGRLLELLDDETVLFPGHGRPWTAVDARFWWQNLGGPPPQERGQLG